MEKLKRKNEIKIKIDFSQIKYDEKTAKSTIRELAKTRKQADLLKKQVKVEILNKKMDDVHKMNNAYEYYICVAIKAVEIENKWERYDYLYDEICYYLDHVCSQENLCDFKNDKCFAKQNTDTTMGCCHHFPDKRFGMLYQKKLIPCEFLGEKRLHDQSNWLQNVYV